MSISLENEIEEKPMYQDILQISNNYNITIKNSPSAIDKELLKYLALLDYQPAHRDLLINTAILYYEQENLEKFNEYLAKAKKVDPNHEVFKN